MKLYTLILFSLIPIDAFANECSKYVADIHSHHFTNTNLSAANELKNCIENYDVCGISGKHIIGGKFDGIQSNEVSGMMLSDKANNACISYYWNGGNSASCAVKVLGVSGLDSSVPCDGIEMENDAKWLSKYINNKKSELQNYNAPCDEGCGPNDDGIYVGYANGFKAGGEGLHGNLKGDLENIVKVEYKVYCINNATPVISKCSGSKGVYVGPFQTKESALQFNKNTGYRLWHVYQSGFLKCSKSMCNYQD